LSFGTSHAQEPDSSYVVLLGTGTPNAEPDKSGTAIAVVAGGVAYLVDAGPGVVRMASKAFEEQDLSSLKPSTLGHVFISHLHSDHTLGLADLIYTPWTLGREEPLRVFGPRGTKAMTDNIQAAYSEDIDMRINGSEPANETGHKLEVDEIDQGLVFENETIKVEAFRVKHGSWEHAFGYRFTTSDKVFVISGDAAPSEAIVEMCQEQRCGRTTIQNSIPRHMN